MRIVVALIAFILAGVALSAQPSAVMECTVFGRVCSCDWHARACSPVCHIEPPLLCAPS